MTIKATLHLLCRIHECYIKLIKKVSEINVACDEHNIYVDERMFLIGLKVRIFWKNFDLKAFYR